MAVDAGYKQTEIGIIPDDWDVKPFQCIAQIERGKFTARPRNDPKYYGGNIPFIQTGDVTNSNGLIKTYTQTLNQEGLKVSKLFSKGTLFFTIAANIADVGFASFDTACPDSLVAIIPNKGIDKHWLAHELRKRKKSFESIATHNAQLNINLEKLRPYLLPIPSITEQEAIAEALNDADDLIAGLERLIAKKRQIKQGAMQELLTGKGRLPGYDKNASHKQTEVGEIPEDWNMISIGSLLYDYRGGASFKPSDFTSYGVKVLPKGGVGRTGWLLIDKEDQKFCSPDYALANYKNQVDETYTIVVLRDLVPSGPSIGLIVQIKNPDVYMLAQGVYGFKVVEDVVPAYLGHLSNTHWYRKLVNSIMVGSTQVHITNNAFKKILIPLPPKSEQESIATILSDMDTEIEILETKLSKARQVKQGMMQELLTGRIRLV